MPRRKIQRTEEEEEKYQEQKRLRNLEAQRKYRNKKKENQTKAITLSENLPNNDVSSPSTSSTSFNQRVSTRSVPNIKNTSINEIKENYIGKMDKQCKYCGALHFNNEIVNKDPESCSSCCGHGKVHLDPMPDCPETLKSLFDGSHTNSNEFYGNIRCYNNAFAFASFNANLVKFNG